MIIASLAIYFSSASMRKSNFYKLLWNKARTTVNVLSNTSKIDADIMLGIEKESPANLHNEKIIIINSINNKIVYTTDENREIDIRNNVLESAKSGYIVTYTQPPFEVIGALFYNDYGGFVVISAATDSDGILFLKKLRTILIIVCLLSLVLFFIAGWLYSGRALKPISDVVKRVEEISITSLNLRVFEGNGTDEISRLAKTFNNMLGRLEVSFAMQKDFISNASHELRTPLTSINGQLEVLMMKDRSSEEYKAAIGSVLDDLRSLIDLANRLLLIARTSSEGSIKLNKKIRVDEIIWQAQEETRRYNKEYRINISLDSALTDSEQMIINGDEALLKVAVSNIIDNACKYSADHTVDIKIEHSYKAIDIVFNDKGIGISEEELHKVFEPFYRASNAITYPGTGIGLQLVNQIIKKHNGTIKITSQLGSGTTVRLKLPAVE